MSARQIVLAVIRLIFNLLSHVVVIGLENVPDYGSAILAMNHLSRIDPPLVVAVVKRPDLTALIADTYKKFPPLRWAIDIMGGIWINRDQVDLDALRKALGFLRQGGLLGIAPEGTRSRNGAMIPAKTGAAYLAAKAAVPVIPVAVSGSEDAFQKLLRFRRPTIELQFGEPFNLPPLDRRERDAALQQDTDEIMCRIAAMLPPSYWGVYRDHPRLAELTNG
jgi:1-acyl-sn-glycerol-3-phosphate acyltransferase